MVNAQNTFTPQPALQAQGAFQANFGAASTAPLAQLAFQVGVQSPINATYQGWNSFLGGGAQMFGGLPFNSNAASSPFGSMAQIGMLFTLIQALSALFQSNQVASPQPYQPSPYQPAQPQPAPYQDLHYQPPVQQPAPTSYQHAEVKAEVKPVVHQQNEAELRAQIEAEVRVQVEQEAQAQAQLNFGGGDGDGGGGGGDGSPIILDLNGDGKLDVTGKGGDMIDFDLFGNGSPIKTEWLKKGTQDGLLVADFNGDGKIDSGRELMRNTGVNGEQHKYANGWDKLGKLFDKNGDGTVSGAELDGLMVWVDSNGDGISDPGELQSVASRGVSEIELPKDGGLISNFTMNGRQQLAEDYIFDIKP